MNDTTTTTITGPAGKLHVDDGGGPAPGAPVPVVFLHSAAGSSAHWARQLAHLRTRHRAIALDLRGHGQSETARAGDYRIASMAEDVTAVVDGLGLDRYVLVGHSMGGAVAASHAASHPERVAGLFLLDAASDGRLIPREQAEGMLAGLRSEGWLDGVWAYWSTLLAASRQEVKDRLLADLRATAREAVVGPLEDLLRFDPVAALAGYQGPRFAVITAANEAPGAYQNLTGIGKLPFRKVEGTGHFVQLDEPELVNQLLDGFLREIR